MKNLIVLSFILLFTTCGELEVIEYPDIPCSESSADCPANSNGGGIGDGSGQMGNSILEGMASFEDTQSFDWAEILDF